MKILVTGATGNVGAYVIEELLKLDEKVVACGTDPNKIKNKFGDRVEVVKLDFTNHNTFKNALCEVDRVFLMRPPHLSKPQDLYPFIRAMKESCIRLVSFLSLMGIENNRIPPHYKIERYIEQIGLPYSHIRPGFFMQNLSGIHSVEIREQDKIFIPAGKSKTSFIDAADIGLAIATVLHQSETYKNTTFTITGSEALDYYQIARAFSNVLGRKITYETPGFFKYRSYYINQRKLEKTLVDVTVALYFMTRTGAAKRITQDFKKLTGKEPKTIHEFISENKKLFIS
jgi:uncharacterized protein YbjT (DUF2867 family)